jgi:thioredoxin reductase (NADPH)
VYGASEGLRTLVLEGEAIGGQASSSHLIRNYLGFARGISGAELARQAYEQAWLFGATFHFMHQATTLGRRGWELVVTLADGTEVTGRTVVLATGVAYRRLGVASLEALSGAGVFYGAPVGGARTLAGLDVYVVGAGNAAGEAALHLARNDARVTLLVRGASFVASMADYLVGEIAAAENIAIRLNTQVVGGGGDGHLDHLVLKDTEDGRSETVPAAALYILIGATPHTTWLPEAIARDATGYLLTGRDLLVGGQLPRGWPLTRPPLPLETSLPGVFAAGDVRYRAVKRVASAVGQGAIAVQSVHDYLADRHASMASAPDRDAAPSTE